MRNCKLICSVPVLLLLLLLLFFSPLPIVTDLESDGQAKQVNKISVRVNGCGLAIVGVVFGLLEN